MATRTVRVVSRGRRRPNPNPLDPKDDSDKPIQIEAEELAADNPTAELPSLVRNGMLSINFQKPHFEVEKDARSVSLAMSLELIGDHRKLLPRQILEAWDDVNSRGYKRIDVLNVPAHFVDLRLTPDQDSSDLCGNAVVEKVVISAIEDDGSGETKDIVRLQFRLKFDLTQEVERFACWQFGKIVWLKAQPVQGELL